jgi:hypothetical protein
MPGLVAEALEVMREAERLLRAPLAADDSAHVGDLVVEIRAVHEHLTDSAHPPTIQAVAASSVTIHDAREFLDHLRLRQSMPIPREPVTSA